MRQLFRGHKLGNFFKHKTRNFHIINQYKMRKVSLKKRDKTDTTIGDNEKSSKITSDEENDDGAENGDADDGASGSRDNNEKITAKVVDSKNKIKKLRNKSSAKTEVDNNSDGSRKNNTNNDAGDAIDKSPANRHKKGKKGKKGEKLSKKGDDNKGEHLSSADEDEANENFIDIGNDKGADKNATKKKRKEIKANKTEDEEKMDLENNEKNDNENDDENSFDGEDKDYEVEDIVGHKIVSGKIIYRIRWKGWSANDDTWGEESTLACPEILQTYKENHPQIKAQKQKTSNPGLFGKIAKKRKKPQQKENFDKNKEEKKSRANDEEKYSSDKQWEVQRILDVHNHKNGTKEFLIRWKGYTAISDTWEPEDNLNCPELIRKYMDKVDEAKNTLEKELRTVRKHTNRFTLMQEARKRRLSKRNDGRQRTVYYDAE